MHFMMIALAALQLQGAQIDTTVQVPPGTRLDVSVGAGTITIQGTDRADVHVTAKVRGSTRVRVALEGAVLRVTSTVPSGVDVAEIAIAMPRAMSLTIGRGDVDITVTGAEGEISAFNHRGRIDITGGRRSIALRSSLGDITLRNARGRVEVQSSQGNVHLIDITGDVQAESTGKHITLDDIDSRSVRATSWGGAINYWGPLHSDGRYAFFTHMGSIFLHVEGNVDATIAVATVSGQFSSRFTYRVAERIRAGIFTAVFGDGRAQVEMESFTGGLVVKQAPRL